MKSKIIYKDGEYSLITKIKDTPSGEREVKIHCIKRDYDNFGKGTGEIIDIPLPKENRKEVYTKAKKFLKSLPKEVTRDSWSLYYEKVNFTLFYNLDKEEILIGVLNTPTRSYFYTFKEFREFVYLEKYGKSYKKVRKEKRKEKIKEKAKNILNGIGTALVLITYLLTIGLYDLLKPKYATKFKKLCLWNKVWLIIFYLILYALLVGVVGGIFYILILNTGYPLKERFIMAGITLGGGAAVSIVPYMIFYAILE